MSVTGVSSSLFIYDNSPIPQQHPTRRMLQFKQEFQQLGEDLKSGDLSAAQSDFAKLQQIGPAALSDPSIQPDNRLAQAFAQLAQDLQSGDLSAAQKDYALVQKVFQHQAERGERHHYAKAQIKQAFDALGQALQAGDLASAQKAFAVLKHDLQKLADSHEHTAAPSPAVPAPPATDTISVTA